MVEIRSDLIAGPADQKAMAERLATYLDGALGTLLNTPAKAGETARQKTSTELANDQVETA